MKTMIVLFMLSVNMIFAQKTDLIKNGPVTLNTTLYSPDKTETIILLHGGPGVPDQMLEIVDILRKTHRVITFEQRGVGQSECKDCSYTMEDYLSDINAIVEKYNIESFHLFGHSWGGLYAQIYAIEHPEKIKSLFLCSPSSGTNSIWDETEKEVMQYNQNNCSNKEWIYMGWNSLLGMLGSDKAYGKVFQQVLQNYYKGYADLHFDHDFYDKIHSRPINKTRKEIRKYKPLPVSSDLKFPITITYGDNDIYGKSKEKLLERFPTAKVITIEQCGHIPWKHNLVAFEKILKDVYELK